MTDAIPASDPNPGAQVLAQSPAAQAKTNGKAGAAALKTSLDRACEAATKCLEEQWKRFETAIHETGSVQPVGISIAIKFRPEKESKKSYRPPQVIVGSKANLPTLRRVFEARDSGGQIVLEFGSDE